MTKINDLIERLDNLSIQECAYLVPILEDKWNVQANPYAGWEVPPPPPPPPEEVKDYFDVHLTSFGEQKIQVVKVLRELTSLPLKECKDLVEQAPVVIFKDASEAQAAEYKDRLEAKGAVIEIK